MKLKIRDDRVLYGQTLHRISGFTDAELHELGSMAYADLRDTLIRILDDRCDGIGTCWACGYGIYSIQFAGSDVIIRTGTSCD